LGAQYQFSKVLEINFSLENISNQRYRSYSSGIAAAGINFIGSVSYFF
jgi:hemoglobin/transferrin/lactoferrin receptor protein